MARLRKLRPPSSATGSDGAQFSFTRKRRVEDAAPYTGGTLYALGEVRSLGWFAEDCFSNI